MIIAASKCHDYTILTAKLKLSMEDIIHLNSIPLYYTIHNLGRIIYNSNPSTLSFEKFFGLNLLEVVMTFCPKVLEENYLELKTVSSTKFMNFIDNCLVYSNYYTIRPGEFHRGFFQNATHTARAMTEHELGTFYKGELIKSEDGTLILKEENLGRAGNLLGFIPLNMLSPEIIANEAFSDTENNGSDESETLPF